MTHTVATEIARQITHRAIPRIYHVPGESFLGLLDALRDESSRLIVARNEGGAGFMALAESRVTGNTGVAMVTRGPGAANIAIAIHTAFQDATPLVVFVGLIPTTDRERESFQEFDIHAWFGSTAKAVMVLDHPGSSAERVSRAFDIAQSGRPGPVVIGLPENLLAVPVAKAPAFPPKHTPSRILGPEETTRFAERLAAAERPVFVVGGECWDTGSAADLRRLAEQAAIPVVSDFRSHDAFPHSSSAWVGSLGYGRNEGARRAYDEADLVVYLGTARKDVLSDGFLLGNGAESVVVVNPDPDLREHTGQLDTHLVSRPDEWLQGFAGVGAGAGAASGAAHAHRTARLAELRATYLAWSQPRPSAPDVLSRETVFGALQEALPNDAIITAGAGNYVIGALRYVHHEVPRSFIGPRNGAMGLGVPGAVAASLAFPERTVVALAGDGCFGMNGQELATLTMFQGRALVFLLDNGGYGTIHAHQERSFPDRPAGTYLQNPDFAGIARAHGIVAHRIEQLDELAPRIAAALASPGSTFFHILLPRINEGLGLHDGSETETR
ncbi:Acetolactate synthase large subunit [Leucobacter sp. 7(1)]|uniref:thiamine pyrophosphate-dependent enzyme n=1 Tax=Leucobacter sp. 7(1) TaxID=1255613 RepID=UPI00097EC8A7|nr:thiamine pyrophosphate-dependent enzyme [Leucobacter sp. 7(1)]SJN11608.1 Acetolactate synthase large subunit [Leucobacter sp. 7(1)]